MNVDLDQIEEALKIQADLEEEKANKEKNEVIWDNRNKMSKKKKMGIFVVVAFILTMIGTSVYYVVFRVQTEEGYAAEITAGENQTVMTAQVTTIYGNEITVEYVEEVPLGTESENGGSSNDSAIPSRGDNSTMPDMSGDSSFPDMNMRNSNTTENSNITTQETETSVYYQTTGETGTYTIPVGTSVITKLGNTTTFSRLAGGDVIKVLVEDTEKGQVVVGIWIVA